MIKRSFLILFVISLAGCSFTTKPTEDGVQKQPKAPKMEPEALLSVLLPLHSKYSWIDDSDKETFIAKAGKVERYKTAMAATVEARGGEFLFSLPDGPSNAFKVLREVLNTLDAHAIAKDEYPLETMDEIVGTIGDLNRDFEAAKAELFAIPEWKALERLITQKEAPTLEQVEALVDDGKFKKFTEPKADELATSLQEYAAKKKALLEARINLDVAASEAFFRYAMDMKFWIKAQPFKAHPSFWAAVRRQHEPLVQAFADFGAEPEAGLKALLPVHPNYAKTVEALAFYRQIQANGGFLTLGKRELKKGAKGQAVEELVQRLAQEGYWEGEIVEVFNQEVVDAVKAYQGTHGFNEDGLVEARHLASLNVPVETRIQQLELSLQRWRETEIRHEEPTYIRINIPEFKMEVWADQEMVLKNRVIVGNNRWDVDPDNQIEGRLNRTKLFTAELTVISINPRWHVPARIKKLELDYELLNDPTYFQKQNFVVKVLPDGREVIYQDSGDSNALGRVKFVFPNSFGIFMHDTNNKRIFDREIRAFSHGCIRLQDPFKVANFLLERLNDVSEARVNHFLAKEEPKDIRLKTPVPIFIEYNSAGVDDKGRGMFFADVYSYDKDYFAGKIPYSEEELQLLQRKIQKVD